MSVDNNYFPMMSLPETVMKMVFLQTGQLSNLCKVSRFFKSFAESEADEIYKKLVDAFGLNVVQYAFFTLKVADKSLPAKIDALFHAANKACAVHENLSGKHSRPMGSEPYDTVRVVGYMQQFAEIEAMDAFWLTVLLTAQPDLQKKMAANALSSDPLKRLCEIRSFFQNYQDEFLTLETLQLINLGLKILPKEIAFLKNLKTLNLSGNQLSVLPSEIAHLKKLKILNVGNNRLSFLPQEIGELTSLIYLIAPNNRLRLLPGEIGELSCLMRLDLNGNQIYQLPNEIGKLTSLCCLCLENNRLSALPEAIGNLHRLQLLYLYNNQIFSLPSTIRFLTSLKVLSAPQNQMTGLPEQIDGLKSLEILMLDHNFLRSLPDAIVNLSNLRDLYLSHNQLVHLPPLPALLNLGFEGNISQPPISKSLARIETETLFHDVYSLLGENKWKEYIDGSYHSFGRRVFDDGAHGGAVEPGYDASMLMLCDFLKANVHRRLDAAFYLEMHKIACAHFNGTATQTLIGQEKVGIFRDEAVSATFPSPHYAMSDEAIQEFNQLNARLSRIFGSFFSLGAIVVASNSPLTWRIDYHSLKRGQVAIIFNLFLSDFNNEMNRASGPEEMLTAIARLIQHLEWLHPPKDGCGRTDTALLNFLMSKYGFNPVLLEFPYLSSCRGLKEWTDILKKGGEAWWEEVFVMRESEQTPAQATSLEEGLKEPSIVPNPKGTVPEDPMDLEFVVPVPAGLPLEDPKNGFYEDNPV